MPSESSADVPRVAASTPAAGHPHEQRRTSPSARQVRDEELESAGKGDLDANYRVHGARKTWPHWRWPCGNATGKAVRTNPGS
jgi:hypothetical protein